MILKQETMKLFTYSLKIALTVAFMALVSISNALPPETEYVGVVAKSGYYDDGYWGQFPIGFDFEFFENTYSDFYVTSNGLLTFGSSSTVYSNAAIPNTNVPNNYIAPFWDDIVIHATGDIMYQTIGTAPNRKLIVQYNNMSFYGSPILLGTFQVILFEGTNTIQTQYRSIVDLTSARASGNSATIGLENSAGTSGVTYSYNTGGTIHSEDAILYTPNGSGSYTIDSDAVYEGVLLVDVIARAGIPNLVSPGNNSTVGEHVNFNWSTTANAVSYYVLISTNSDLSSPIHTSADLTTLNYEYTVPLNNTYYWSVNAKNSSGVVTWSEIWKFEASATPPLVAVSQTAYVEQGDQRSLTLVYTGGDESTKIATITSLPAEGSLYQYTSDGFGAEITSVPTALNDASHRLFYSADGDVGNGKGNFEFTISDDSSTSEAEEYILNVTPPGIPNFLQAAKQSDRIEITFDRDMADPTGKHLEFSIQDGGVDITPVSCFLKPGDPSSIVVTVGSTMNTSNALAIAYTKGTVLASSGGILETFDFQIAGKLAQTIDFDALADKVFGDPAFEYVATTSSGLPVVFSSSNSTVVSLTSSNVVVNNAGECIITATQAGNSEYSAVSFERVQVVSPAIGTVSLEDLERDYTGGALNASASTEPAGLNVTFLYDGSSTPPIDIGVYTVVASINGGNYQGSASGSFEIYDLSAPVADVADLPMVTGECSASANAPSATDVLEGPIIATTTTEFPVYESTDVTWKFVDSSGNESTQVQSIVIADITAPEAPVLDAVVGECSVTASVPMATDACAGEVLGTTADELTKSIVGTHEITWTFDDGRGNSIQVVQEVVVLDSTEPEIPILTAVSGECSVTASAPTTFDDCAGLITGTTFDELTKSTVGRHEITWTFDDGHGNAIDVVQEIRVLDSTMPEMPNLSALSGECSVTAAVPTTIDECSGLITGTTSDELTKSTLGTHEITWTFDDGNGNAIDVVQEVVVLDSIEPEVPTLAELSGECSVTASAPTAFDDCAGVITGTTSDELTKSTVGTHEITWTFDDGHGNAVDVVQVVTVVDSTEPEMPNLPALSGECSVTAEVPTTIDDCVGLIMGTTPDELTKTTAGIHEITWTFDDGNGNAIEVVQELEVIDSTEPAMPNLSAQSGECSVTVIAPNTFDECRGMIGGTTNDPTTYTEVGHHEITWTFDDGNGNSIETIQHVVVEDTTPPEMPLLTAVSGECSVTAEAPTTFDDCAGEIIGVTYDQATQTVAGTHEITWHFNDGHGNSVQAVQEIVVIDTTAPEMPVLEPISGECSVTAVAPTTMDECVGMITGVASNDLTYTEVGTHEITWVFDDGNGNVVEATQELVVTDLTAPEVPQLQDATVQCSAAVSAPTAFDGCMGEILGTTSDPVAFLAPGTYEVNWIFDDGNGNTIDVNQNVIVEDTEAPSATCPDNITVTVNDSDPNYLVQGDEFDLLLAEDNCGVQEFENDFNLSSTLDQAIFEVGTTIINWVVSDYSGNSNTCSTEITVESIVSVGEITDDFNLKIFPNPNTGIFSLDFVSAAKGEVNVTILNYEGRTVYSETFDKDSEDFSRNINIEQVATGVYLVGVYTDNFSAKKRVSIINGNNE